MKAKDWVGRWAGRTVVCIASGPSLTVEDCEAVQASGHPTIVTNTTFKRCPWADVLFGFDAKWWKEYSAEVADTFKGERITCSIIGPKLGIKTLHQQPWFQACGNSGTAAISLAVHAHAQRILLLGFDCQKTGGRTHWHGDHPKTLGNARSISNWPRQFSMVAKFAKGKGVPVINCTRETALTCFPRVDLNASL